MQTNANINVAAQCFMDYGHDLCELYESDNAVYFLQHCNCAVNANNVSKFYVAVKQLFEDYTQQV